MSQAIDLTYLDVSKPEFFENDTWMEGFAELRKSSPVHYTENSANGAYWSVVSHELIKQVDIDHKTFSSERGGISIVDAIEADRMSDDNDGIAIAAKSFINMDEPEHKKQRLAVSPSVGPKNLAELQPLIRERAADILDLSLIHI